MTISCVHNLTVNNSLNLVTTGFHRHSSHTQHDLIGASLSEPHTSGTYVVFTKISCMKTENPTLACHALHLQKFPL